MAISLDWEESVFLGLRHLMRKFKAEPAPRYDPEHGLRLSPLIPRLSTLAAIMAERPVIVRESEAMGGVRGAVLLLPEGVDMAPDRESNMNLFLLRTVIGASMIHAGYATPGSGPGSELEERLRFLCAACRTTAELRLAYPRFSESLDSAIALELAHRPNKDTLNAAERELELVRRTLLQSAGPPPLQDLLRRMAPYRDKSFRTPGLFLWGESLSSADVGTACNAEKERDQLNHGQEGTELQAPARDEITRQMLASEEEVKPMPIHTFEKVETLDAYKGGNRQVDGSDELADHEEALSELDIRELVRDGTETRGFFKVDLDLPGGIPDVEHTTKDERAVLYPEWFFRKRCYRPNWAAVYPALIQETDPSWGVRVVREQRRVINELHAALLTQRTKLVNRRRQPHGPEIDVDALVDRYCLQKAGHDGGEMVYEQRRKLQRDTATLVLLDTSLSAGGWIEGRRVLDATREAVIILGEVTHRLDDNLAVLSFASKTRNLCRVWQLKGWDESWSRGRGRLGLMKPQGYTRIGPALRHATAVLSRSEARNRLLLLVTDGKPTDYDRYEGRYGIEDVKMACREARQMGITIHALGLDPSARANLPVMFGTGGWELIRHMKQLPMALTRAYARMV